MRAGGVLFLGHGAMAEAALEALCAHGAPPDLVLSTSPRPSNAVPGVAEGHGLPWRAVSRREPVEEVMMGLAQAPMAALCCAWPHRLGPEVLRVPLRGWFNLHPSGLPLWRGGLPIPWQLAFRVQRVGCTVHEMTPRFDDGPVIVRDEVVVADGVAGDVVRNSCGTVLGRLAAGVVRQLANDIEPERQPQPVEESTLCPPLGVVPLLRPEYMPARAAVRLIQAFSPLPGVALQPLGAETRVAHAAVGPPRSTQTPAGQVRTEGEGVLAVACQDRWVRCTAVPG